MATRKTPRKKKPVSARSRAAPGAKVKKETWKALDREKTDDTIDHLFHFSSKACNSNAAPVGIRIAADPLDIPYVGVSTLPPGLVPVDYVRGAKDANALKQISGVLNMPGAPDYLSIPEEDALYIRQAAERLNTQAEFGTETLDPRLRQVLWPLDPESPEDSDYVSLTPLPSCGLATEVQRRTNEATTPPVADSISQSDETPEKSVKSKYWQKATLPYGGSNPHNIGRYTRDLQKPLVFRAPQMETPVRKAWRLHFKGVSWLCARQEIYAWFKTRKAREIKKTAGTSDRWTRLKEQQHIEAIARKTIDTARIAETQLLELGLPEGQLTSRSLPDATRALIDSSRRTRTWPQEFSIYLLRALSQAKIHDRGKLVSLGLAETDALQLRPIVESVAR